VEQNTTKNKYWQENLKLVAGCLLVWLTVSFGFGIILLEPLNQVQFFGFELGFWFAQQGSILCFVGLIFYYAWRMNGLDKKHDVEED
tara:strand:- start:291 stop:551 length:261 start_codon:yes stop_codon:yes gene_type:complete